MTRFKSIYNDWILPIALCVGHILLASLLVIPVFRRPDGWIVPVFGIVHWLYGYAFHSDLVPFFKRLMNLRRKETEK